MKTIKEKLDHKEFLTRTRIRLFNDAIGIIKELDFPINHENITENWEIYILKRCAKQINENKKASILRIEAKLFEAKAKNKLVNAEIAELS